MLLLSFLLSASAFLITPSILAAVRVDMESGAEEIGSFNDGGVEYISLSGLADLLDTQLDWEVVGHEVKWVDRNNRIDFLVGSPYVKVNDRSYNLTYPVSLRKGQLYVPAATFLSYFNKVTADRISWDNRSKSVRVQSSYFNVTDVSLEPKANGLLIEVFLTDDLAYDVFVTTGNWVNISIRDGVLDIPKIESRMDKRYLYDLKGHQEEGVAQVSLQVRRDVKNIHHKLVQNPTRIQISIPDLNFTMDAEPSSPPPPPKGKFDGKIDVIAIDPGHGGDDYGAVGANNTREKEVTLAIARKLSDIIKDDGRFKVVMTRNSDKTLTLQERADAANEAGADLFLSIHANANPRKNIRGWNVFFLAPAKNDSARSVEQLENSYFVRQITGEPEEKEKVGPSDANPIVSILNEMLMTEFQTESHDLAMMIDKEFRDALNIPARGVDQAGFFVLNKVFTPSVLVETAFITNKADAKLLRDGGFQKTVAVSLYEAVKRFAAKYDTR